MQERIHELLNLCIQAQEKGHNIQFQQSIHGVEILYFTSGDAGLEMPWSIRINSGLESADYGFNMAESYLKELISNVCSG